MTQPQGLSLIHIWPLICHALEVFENSCADEIVLVTGAGEEEYVRREILSSMNLKKPVTVTAGGKERYHSVYEGLKALKDCSYCLLYTSKMSDSGAFGLPDGSAPQNQRTKEDNTMKSCEGQGGTCR